MELIDEYAQDEYAQDFEGRFERSYGKCPGMDQSS